MVKTVTKIISNSLFVALLLTCTTCKKRTSVTVSLYNDGLEEFVKGATIVLVEKKGPNGSLFDSHSSCREIASAVTDANGEVVFEKEKLRSREEFQYFCAVKEAWGVTQGYPCDGKTSGFITKGGTQAVTLKDFGEGAYKIQYNNIFSPGTNGDSLIYKIYRPKDGPQGGPIVLDYNTFYPEPSVFYSQELKINAGKLVVSIRKRKLGIVSTSLDTVKVYPNQLTVIQITW